MAIAPSTTVYVQLLGGFRISVQDQCVLDDGWSRRKPLAIVKLLALQPERRMHREQMLAALWPDLDAHAAATNLRKNRLYLREALPPDVGDIVALAGDTIALDPRVVTDLEEFLQVAALALDRQLDVALFQQALDGHTGSLLPHDPFEPWTEGPREDVRSLWRRLLVELSDLQLSRGNVAEAAAALETLLGAAPADEDAHRALMRLHQHSGRRDLALQQYEHCREALSRELGVEPEAETVALHEEIRNGRRGRRTSFEAETFVGRARELAELRAMFDAASNGAGRVALITGDAGIGKTRLAEAIAAYARLRGASVAWGRSYEDDAHQGYAPWMQILEAQMRDLGSRDGSAGSDQPGAFTRGARGDAASIRPAEAVSEQQQLFTRICGFLRAASRSRPLVIVLDDLHWTDADSLALLQYAVRDLRDAPILFICTYRDIDAAAYDRLSDVSRTLLRERHAQEIHLVELNASESSDLVAWLAGGDASPDLIHNVIEHTQGNPLFLTEMMRLVARTGTQSASAGDSTLVIPAQVKDVIRRRLGRLPEDTRRLLATASVIGQEFPLALLARATETEEVQLVRLLEPALDSGLLHDGVTPGTYRFSHPLFRTVAYDDQPPSERAFQHLRIGDAIESVHGDSEEHAAELAHHFRHAVPAGGAERAVRYGTRAALYAIALTAYVESARLFDQALAIHEAEFPGDHRRRCELLLFAARWRRSAGRADEARAAADEALRVARIDGSADLIARSVVTAAKGNLSSITVDEELIAQLEEAVELVADSAPVLRADLLARLAERLSASGDVNRCDEIATEAESLARTHGDPALIADVLWACHDAISGPDNVRRRIVMADDMIRFGRQTRDKTAVAGGHVRRATAFLELGDIARMDQEVAALDLIVEERRLPGLRRWAPLLHATRALLTGDLESAERLSAEALDANKEAADPDWPAIFAAQLFMLRWQQGRAGELESVVKGALQPTPGFLPWRAALAVLYAELGQEAHARAEFEFFAASDFTIVPRSRYWTIMMVMLTEVCAFLRDETRADHLYGLLLPVRDHLGVGATAHVCTGSNERSLGMLASTMRRWDVAEEHFQRAASVNRALGAAPWVARTLAAHGEMLLDRNSDGDRGRAAAMLKEAKIIADEVGMNGVSARIEKSVVPSKR